MDNATKNTAAKELICTMVLPELSDALAMAIDALQSDCEIDRDEAKDLIHGHFERMARKYPQHIHKPDYGVIFYGLTVIEDTSTHHTDSDDSDDSEPPLYGDLPAAA